MRNSRLKTVQTTNPANAKTIFNIITPKLIRDTHLTLNLPEVLLLSAITSEINEAVTYINDEPKLNKLNAIYNRNINTVIRQLKPSYLLERYPLLHFTSTKRIKEIRSQLNLLHLINMDKDFTDFIYLTRDFHNIIFASPLAIMGYTFLTIPQYAIVTHDSLWRLSPTHIIIGLAIIRILQTNGIARWIDANLLTQTTGLDLGYRQFIRYIDDLIQLGVLAHIKESNTQRFVLTIGNKGRYLLVESNEVLQTNATLYFSMS